MTHKERFASALRRKPVTGHVPTFELVFFLTMEAFGRIHPTHRHFEQWKQMSETERELHRRDIAELYVAIAKKYHHDCIFYQDFHPEIEENIRVLELIRELGGEDYFIVMHGDPTFSIPDGEHMMEESIRFFDKSEEMHRLAQANVNYYIRRTEQLVKPGDLLDGICMCADYCFNTNPFLSPAMFGEFVSPYLKQICDEYRSMGLYTIKHTDGNIMPIVDQLVQAGPDALHSLDPQGGVLLSEVKRLYGNKVALCGNVNCALLQAGSDEEAAADVRRSLREGMDGWGYIFCTSNCVYTGLALERYEMMMDIWQKEGVYSS